MSVEHAMQAGALGLVSVALGVVSYLAVMGSEQAQGAMIAVLTAGVGYFLRGRVAAPTS